MNFLQDYSNVLNPRLACRIAEAEYIKNPRDVDVPSSPFCNF